MDFVFPPSPRASVAVFGREERFPVRRIYLVGRNYAEHAREMGNDPDKEPPFFFSKPSDAIIEDGATLAYPMQTENLHFEGELVVAIGAGGAEIPRQKALDFVWGYACGNDLTRRDLQTLAKERRRPWDLAKGFDHSAVCGALHPVTEFGHVKSGSISTLVNGTIRQKGDLRDMIWPVEDVIAFLSQSVALAAGDLIYTGTPAGVGPLQHGDHCVVEIDGLSCASITVSQDQGRG